MNTDKWLRANAGTLAGKTVAITGSTGGLGREICKYLALLGARLILIDRDAGRSYLHKKDIVSEFPETLVECIGADLSDMQAVSLVTEELGKMEIDVFIHNAGAYSIPRHVCDTGYDNVFQINFASPYYMIRELLPVLRKRGGKVIAVGSIAHNYSKTDKNDIDFKGRKAASKVYGNAKRYLMFSLAGLFSNETDVKLSIVHPGITLTNITAHYPKFIYALIKLPMKIIFMSPSIAALCVLKGVFDSTAYDEWIGPRILDVWGYPRKKKLLTCKQDERDFISSVAQSVYLNLKNT